MHSYRLPDLEAFMRRPDLNTAFFSMVYAIDYYWTRLSSVSSEREKGFLKVLSVQGASFGQLLAGKFMALYTATLMFIVPPLIIMVGGLIFEGEPASYLIRAGYWIILYAVYFLLVAGGVLLISALSRSSWSSLMANITVWVFSVLLIPKFSTSVADNLYPLPSYHEFEHNVKTGFDKGLGNDGDYTSRSEIYLKKHLNQFNATSIDQLPEKVRFALDLVQAEAYENKVNAFYSKQVEGKFNQQQKFMDYMGLINPFIAVRQLSMAFAGTDVQHHIDFFNKAEEYRNNMMNRLNKREFEIAVSGKLKVNNQEFYSRFPDFKYRYPAVGSVICNHTIAILSLLLWTLTLIFSFRLIIKRNNF
jgi:ABC-2 type transport system permease protein